MTIEALETLKQAVRDQRLALAGLARHEGLSAHDALDCVHDAFCTFLELAQRGECPSDAAEQARLLAGIVVNTARNGRRRHRLARPHDELGEERLGDDRPLSDALLEHAEDCVRLRGCVSRLCEKQRTVVMMRLLEERAGEDVAAALGLTRSHVDVLLHRAKASLAACMTKS
jgi:RNA polymerase sigma-70 factor (ECF subfamily)